MILSATTCASPMASSTVSARPASDAPVDEALSLMREHAVKRLPVLDEDRQLCGIITEADIATHISQERTGELVGAIASARPQHF